MFELHDQLPLAVLSDSRTLFEAGLIIVLAAAAPRSKGHTEVGEGAIAMFVLSPDTLRVITAGDAPKPAPGDELIGLAEPPR